MFSYTVAMVNSNHFEIEAYNENIYDSMPEDSILNIKTYYEKQWLERGITIKYLRFKPQKQSMLIEPDIDIEPDSYRSFKRDRRV